MSYDLKPMKAPRAAGRMLRMLVAALEGPAGGRLLANKLLSDAGIAALRNKPAGCAPDMRLPVFDHGEPCHPVDAPPADLDGLYATCADLLPHGSYQPETIGEFAAAYRQGSVTPVDVAERALEILADSEAKTPAMRVLIDCKRDDVMKQAQASAARYAAGTPRSVLDGVPVAVKDELDQAPYPTTVGTRFLGTAPAKHDATVVARLRTAGALLIGKANMHEIGLGVTGVNPHHGSARNPYNPHHVTGGSSSGSAAAVAMGLCPLAVGADGGGSVRVPAALCGQVGLKATFGRISEHGAAELCWSVAHIGPIASSVRDCALGYALMAGADARDTCSQMQPSPSFDGIIDHDLTGKRIGIFRPWFEDANSEVVAQCEHGLSLLTRAGATLVDVTLAELEAMRVAHLISIVSEMVAAHAQYYRDHRADYGLDVRLSLALGRQLSAADYVHAQRHRALVYRRFAKVLAEVDVIATPMTGMTAPVLPLDALATGESNLEVTGNIIRFATAANLTGLPAITVPVGYDGGGLPVGLQLIGGAWQEAMLLRLAAVVEAGSARQVPLIHYRYLAAER